MWSQCLWQVFLCVLVRWRQASPLWTRWDWTRALTTCWPWSVSTRRKLTAAQWVIIHRTCSVQNDYFRAWSDVRFSGGVLQLVLWRTSCSRVLRQPSPLQVQLESIWCPHEHHQPGHLPQRQQGVEASLHCSVLVFICLFFFIRFVPFGLALVLSSTSWHLVTCQLWVMQPSFIN